VRTLPSALTGAIALSLVLAGCSGGDDGATTPESGAGAEASSGASEGTERGDGALPVEYEVSPVDFGPAGAVTPPGTALAVGQPAWLNQTVTFGEDEVTGGVGVSVLAVRKLDPAIFEQFSNADEFAQYTPYAVVTQQQWLYDVPADYSPETVDLFPIAEDGSDAEYLTSGFSLNSPGDSCGLLLPEYDEENQILISCFVALSERDLRVTSAEYNGESYQSFLASSDNAYFPAPVTWK
jgi:hypothetical protein